MNVTKWFSQENHLRRPVCQDDIAVGIVNSV